MSYRERLVAAPLHEAEPQPLAGPGRRCLVCQARAVIRERERVRCAWCGGRWNVGARDPWPALQRLCAGDGDVVADPSRLAGVLLDDYTFRMAATRFGRRFHPSDGDVVAGHAERFARGRLSTLEPGRASTVTLAIISPSDDPRLVPLAAALAPRFAATVVVVDPRRDRQAAEALGNLATVAAIDVPLVRFDASRNVAQSAARTAWTFHLDTDETVEADLLDTLGALTRLADDSGLDAIGFARKNLVGGVASDVYPDVQYRLVRRTVRFLGAVHERPDACTDWTRTMIALTGEITHHMSAAQVRARAGRYGALGQIAERDCENAALLMPFAP